MQRIPLWVFLAAVAGLVGPDALGADSEPAGDELGDDDDGGDDDSADDDSAEDGQAADLRAMGDVELVYHLFGTLRTWSASHLALEGEPLRDTRVQEAIAAVSHVLASVLPPIPEDGGEPDAIPTERATLAASAIRTVSEHVFHIDNLDSTQAPFLLFFDALRADDPRTRGDDHFPVSSPESYLFYVNGKLELLNARDCGGDATCAMDHIGQAAPSFETAAKRATVGRARALSLWGALEAYEGYLDLGDKLTPIQGLAAAQNAVACALEARAYDAGDPSTDAKVGRPLELLAAKAVDAGQYEAAVAAGQWTWRYTHDGGLDVRELMGGAAAPARADPAKGEVVAVIPAPVTEPQWKDLVVPPAPPQRNPVVSGDYERAPATYFFATHAAHVLLFATPDCGADHAAACIVQAGHFFKEVDRQIKNGTASAHRAHWLSYANQLADPETNYCGVEHPAAISVRKNIRGVAARLTALPSSGSSQVAGGVLDDELRSEVSTERLRDEIDIYETLIRDLKTSQSRLASLPRSDRTSSTGEVTSVVDALVLTPAMAIAVIQEVWLTHEGANEDQQRRIKEVIDAAAVLAATDLAFLGGLAEYTAAYLLRDAGALTESPLEIDGDLLGRLHGQLNAKKVGALESRCIPLGGLVVVHGAPSELESWVGDQSSMDEDWGLRAAPTSGDPSQRTHAAAAAVAYRESLRLASAGVSRSLFGRSGTGMTLVELPPVFGTLKLQQDGANQALRMEIPAPGQRVVLTLDSSANLRLAGVASPISRGATQIAQGAHSP